MEDHLERCSFFEFHDVFERGTRKKLLEKSPGAFSCGRWDLNPHDRIDHKILSLARLPIPTLPRNILEYSRGREECQGGFYDFLKLFKSSIF